MPGTAKRQHRAWKRHGQHHGCLYGNSSTLGPRSNEPRGGEGEVSETQRERVGHMWTHSQRCLRGTGLGGSLFTHGSIKFIQLQCFLSECSGGAFRMWVNVKVGHTF